MTAQLELDFSAAAARGEQVPLGRCRKCGHPEYAHWRLSNGARAECADEGGRCSCRYFERDAESEWCTGCLPERAGGLAYVEMIRAKGDPERRKRGSYGREGADRWKRELKGHPSVWGPRIEEALGDGEARTLNRLSVEMADLTADITAGTALGEALWALVEAGAVEFTMRAPVLFRWRGPPERAPDWGAASERVIKGES